MSFHIGLLGEALIADLTLEGFLSCVAPHVLLKVKGPNEHLVAMWTLLSGWKKGKKITPRELVSHSSSAGIMCLRTWPDLMALFAMAFCTDGL